jgi:hypothetical protein
MVSCRTQVLPVTACDRHSVTRSMVPDLAPQIMTLLIYLRFKRKLQESTPIFTAGIQYGTHAQRKAEVAPLTIKCISAEAWYRRDRGNDHSILQSEGSIPTFATVTVIKIS